MKLKCALIALFVVSSISSASASRLTDADLDRRNDACELSKYDQAVLQERWNKLAMKLFMASMEYQNPTIDMGQVRREVDHGVAKLRKRYGPACVLDVR